MGKFLTPPQAVLYGNDWEQQIRNATAHSKTEHDLKDSTFVDELKKIDEQLTSETSEAHVEESGDAYGLDSDAEESLTLTETTTVVEKIKRTVLKSMADDGKQIDDSDESGTQLTKWLEHAEKLARERCSLIVEPKSEPALLESFSEVPIMKATAGKKLVIYDVKQSGESSSRPAYRAPSFRKQHLRKLVGAVLQCETNRTAMPNNCIFYITVAGKNGNDHDVASSFLNADGKQLQKEKKTVYVQYSEKSVTDRRECNRGALDVMEFAYVFTSQPIMFEERKHKVYDCSVRSNLVGPVGRPDVDGLWQLTYGEKKKLYGDAGIVAVGGKDTASALDDGESPSHQKPRNNSTQEPVAWAAESVEYYTDLIDWFKAWPFQRHLVGRGLGRWGRGHRAESRARAEREREREREEREREREREERGRERERERDRDRERTEREREREEERERRERERE